MDKLPQRLQTRAKEQLHEIMHAPDRGSALKEVWIFREEFEAKYPKAVACFDGDLTVLLTFLDFPAEHWLHLRTTNVIESVFAPVKGRTRKTKGAGSRRAGLAMAFKLVEAGQSRWRKACTPHGV